MNTRLCYTLWFVGILISLLMSGCHKEEPPEVNHIEVSGLKRAKVIIDPDRDVDLDQTTAPLPKTEEVEDDTEAEFDVKAEPDPTDEEPSAPTEHTSTSITVTGNKGGSISISTPGGTVASWNGHRIETNKPGLHSTHPNVITFFDGSSCTFEPPKSGHCGEHKT